MANANHVINITINLDEGAFAESCERLVHAAYMAGFERAQRVGQQEPPETGYEDWRGYGPGALLPGGEIAARGIRARDHARDTIARERNMTRAEFLEHLRQTKSDDPRNGQLLELMEGETGT